MSLLAESMSDHRGRPVQLHALRSIDSSSAELPREAARLIRGAIRSLRSPWTARMSFPFLVPILITCTLAVAISVGVPLAPHLFAIAMGFLASGVIGALFGDASPPEIVRGFLSQGRCPCCAYPITALKPDPDGCTTCPECSAAWNLGPARHPA